MSEPLFRRLIGPDFDALPEAIRAVHEGRPVRIHRGHCEVIRGGGLLSRLCGWIAGLPPAGEAIPTRVAITVSGDAEVWQRDFGGHGLRSCLSARGGKLEERLGPSVFHFRLISEAGAIRWDLVGTRVLGIPLPEIAAARIFARESLLDGRYHFDVRAALPFVGLLVHYRGTLEAALE